MNMELPLSKKECAMAVSYHNDKRKQSSAFEGKRRISMSFESFEAHCEQVLASGQQEVLVMAEGTGKGGRVRIKDYFIDGAVNSNVEKGQQVKVAVRKIVPETKTVILELR